MVTSDMNLMTVISVAYQVDAIGMSTFHLNEKKRVHHEGYRQTVQFSVRNSRNVARNE